MKSALTAFCALALTATTALANAEFHPSTYTTYMQHGPYKGNVQVMHRLPSDDLSYTEIGMVRISTRNVGNYYEALDQIKRAAAAHGGNAIVLEDDAKLYAAGMTTNSGSAPQNVTAIALIYHK